MNDFLMETVTEKGDSVRVKFKLEFLMTLKIDSQVWLAFMAEF